jgi:hypothetical protein
MPLLSNQLRAIAAPTSENFAAEIVDCHLGSQHRTGPHDVLVHPGHVGQDPDLHRLQGFRGHTRRRQRPANQKPDAKGGRKSNWFPRHGFPTLYGVRCGRLKLHGLDNLPDDLIR